MRKDQCFWILEAIRKPNSRKNVWINGTKKSGFRFFRIWGSDDDYRRFQLVCNSKKSGLLLLISVKIYSNHQNTGHVWYSSGPIVYGCQMVWFSNVGLKTGQKMSVVWPKMSGFGMVCQIIWKPGKNEYEKSNLRISGVWYSHGYCNGQLCVAVFKRPFFNSYFMFNF